MIPRTRSMREMSDTWAEPPDGCECNCETYRDHEEKVAGFEQAMNDQKYEEMRERRLNG